MITFRGPRYVSRGGKKLEHALSVFGTEVAGKVAVDAGSSTGGFTDCLIRHGVSKVYAVDSGHNQLDYSLRTDERVIAMERTNIMEVECLNPKPHFATCDLSFRSIRRVASHLIRITSDQLAIVLVKPQYEWKNPQSGFSGVIRDASVLIDILAQSLHDLEKEAAFVGNVTESPIRGRRGNREFFFLLSSTQKVDSSDAARLVRKVVCLEGLP